MGEVGRHRRGPLSLLHPGSRGEDKTSKVAVHILGEKVGGENCSLLGRGRRRHTEQLQLPTVLYTHDSE